MHIMQVPNHNSVTHDSRCKAFSSDFRLPTSVLFYALFYKLAYIFV
jgi:hypothetical protein